MIYTFFVILLYIWYILWNRSIKQKNIFIWIRDSFFLFYQKYIYLEYRWKLKNIIRAKEREREKRERKKLRKSNHISYLINILLEIDESMKWAMYIYIMGNENRNGIDSSSLISFSLSLSLTLCFDAYPRKQRGKEIITLSNNKNKTLYSII